MSRRMTRVHRSGGCRKPWSGKTNREANRDPLWQMSVMKEELDVCLSCDLPPEKCSGSEYCYRKHLGKAAGPPMRAKA